VNWPAIFSVTFVVVSVPMGLVFARLSLRQRSMHHLMIVFLCVLSMSLLDPPANWVTFTVFDPQFLHYPTSWHWMSLAPLIEPIVNPPGYPFYFLTVALCCAWVAKKVLARSRPGSWAARVWRNLTRYEFPGPIYLINPGRTSVWDRPCYPDFKSLPEPPDHLVDGRSGQLHRPRQIRPLQHVRSGGIASDCLNIRLSKLCNERV